MARAPIYTGVAENASDTTNVHGIADTSQVVLQTTLVSTVNTQVDSKMGTAITVSTAAASGTPTAGQFLWVQY